VASVAQEKTFGEKKKQWQGRVEAVIGEEYVFSTVILLVGWVAD
jgi:hypothetical protein